MAHRDFMPEKGMFSREHRIGKRHIPVCKSKRVRRELLAVSISAFIVLMLGLAVILLNTAAPSVPDTPPVIQHVPSTIESTVK